MGDRECLCGEGGTAFVRLIPFKLIECVPLLAMVVLTHPYAFPGKLDRVRQNHEGPTKHSPTFLARMSFSYLFKIVLVECNNGDKQLFRDAGFKNQGKR